MRRGMERELSAALLPVAGKALSADSAPGDKLKIERYHHEQGTRDADVRSDRAALAWGSGPQATLGQPRMGAHILLIFGAHLSLHQLHIFPERHALAMQAFDRNRLDELPWRQISKCFSAAFTQQVTRLSSEGSVHVVVLAVDGEIALGPYGPRKGSLIDAAPSQWEVTTVWGTAGTVGNAG
jgi:hypothetical protein